MRRKWPAPRSLSAEAYPYFFFDTNANGQADADEAVFPNSYKSSDVATAWKSRIQLPDFTESPGAYVHGGKYITVFCTIRLKA